MGKKRKPPGYVTIFYPYKYGWTFALHGTDGIKFVDSTLAMKWIKIQQQQQQQIDCPMPVVSAVFHQNFLIPSAYRLCMCCACACVYLNTGCATPSFIFVASKFIQ